MAPMPRSARRRPGLWAVASVLLAYIVAGKIGLQLAFVNASATAVWPPTGIALAALLILGRRVWPVVFVGALVVNATTAGSLVSSVGIAAGDTLEAVVGAYLADTFAGGRRAFERPRDLFRFAALGAGGSALVGASVGLASLGLTGSVARADAAAVWLTWWLGDASGALVVTPLLLLWKVDRSVRPDARAPTEVAALALAVVATGLVIFGGAGPLSASRYSVEFLAFPPLVWAAFRFGPRATAAAAMALSAFAVWGTVRGFGPFAGEHPNESLLLLQAFMGVAAVMSMALAAALLERRRAEMGQRLLSDAGAVVASSLDTQTMLRSIADLAVPQLADWCSVYAVDLDGRLRGVAGAHADPSKNALLQQLQLTYPPTPEGNQVLSRVIRTGQAVLEPSVTRELWDATSAGAEHDELRTALGFASFIGVPLVARGRTVGAAFFAAGPARRDYGPRDLLVAEELGRRAGLALDNARLHTQLRESRQALVHAEHRVRRETAELLRSRVQSRLVVAWHRLGDCARLLEQDPAEARRVLQQTRDELEAVRERDLHAASDRLHPGIIGIGLVPAVRSLLGAADGIVAAHLDVDDRLAALDTPMGDGISSLARLAAYRVVEEAVANVLRHADADNVWVSLGFDVGGVLRVRVRDDGRGFDWREHARGLGLGAAAARVDELGGEWRVESAPGKGTTVTASLPLAEDGLDTGGTLGRQGASTVITGIVSRYAGGDAVPDQGR